MNNQPGLQVAIIDDDEAVRDSLGWLLEAQGNLVSRFSSADDFLATWNPATTGCLVLDIRMPGMTGIELHDLLVREGHDVPVIFVTGHGDVPMAVSRIKKGAVDFLQKPFSHDDLRKLVEQALNHAEQLRNDAKLQADQHQRLAKLTQREKQVLERIVAGRLNKQIADDLDISIKTVEAHRANIMEKLGARTMADLMKIALSVNG
jgi:two-component system, LuxR family, response regulator TtrR